MVLIFRDLNVHTHTHILCQFSDEELAENVATLEKFGYAGKIATISLHYVLQSSSKCNDKVSTDSNNNRTVFVKFIRVADTFEEVLAPISYAVFKERIYADNFLDAAGKLHDLLEDSLWSSF